MKPLLNRMKANNEHPRLLRPATRPPYGGWTGLQRREGDDFLKWLRREQCLKKGLDALAIALKATLNDLVRTDADARAVWRVAPAVLRNCNDPETYSKPQAETAYAWLHMLDRYVRTWLAFEHLVRASLLPMGKFGVRALDVGTGPGPSAFATHDFFAAMQHYARATASTHWEQPPQITCVECAPGMNLIRHLVAERLAVAGAPRSVLDVTGGLHDFGGLYPTLERKQLANSLRNKYDEYWNECRGELDAEPVYTLEEASREASSHHRYRLFTFCNFLTTLDIVSDFQDNIEESFADAHAGSVLLMIGGKGGCYPTIRERIAKLAEASGFRRHNDTGTVGSADTKLDRRLGNELRSFYCRLKRLAVELPKNGPYGAELRSELEDCRPVEFRESKVLAFRK
ncbi:MAG: hypothetical protein OXJ64_18880 [Boseongicola sp.]|nr:hypothetical protein [Boseongicola sp.]